VRVVVLISVLVALAASCASASGFFPMGVWYEGGVGAFRNDLIPEDPALAAKDYQRDFADMAAHGVNAAVVPNTQPNHHKPLLDAAGANGVKLIVELDRDGGELGQMIRGSLPLSDDAISKTFDTKLKPIVNHPALWGVQLLDEPAPGTYDRYAKVAKSLKRYAPRLQPFSCLIGSGPVDSFCKITKPAVVAFDCYPVGVGSKIGDPAPMLQYDSVANAACVAAAKYDVPVWAVLQVHSITGSLRFPTPPEIRCMTYLALANGCKGIWWFLYQTEYWNKAKNEFMGGLVDQNFKGDARWEEISKLTSEMRKISPTLLGLNIASDVAVKADTVAHVLKDSEGRLYIFAVNSNTVSARKVTLRLDQAATGSRDPEVVKLPAGTSIPCDLLGDKVIWSDTLAPGDGALYSIR
jgi:hypothetical protein